MCLKRQRDELSLALPPNQPPKRHLVESELDYRRAMVRSWGNQPLRQAKEIELISSENFVCRAAMETLGKHLTNKYSKRLPGARYYTGNQYTDEIESLCCSRALVAFGLDSDKWCVNLQPYSRTSTNCVAHTGHLLSGDRIMGLDSPSGGHLSHGYYTAGGKNVSASSNFFETLPSKVNPQTGYIDYEQMDEKAADFRAKILICGGSTYQWDYSRFKQVADKIGAVLMCDMAHFSGLVSAKECVSPFDYCDIVTSTTHKSLCGPRGGIILSRKGAKPRKQGTLPNHGDGNSHYDFEERINFAVHPSLQGGPHNNHIAALAIAFKQVASPEYKAYMQQVKKNAQALACPLLRRKFRLVTGDTDNHLLLWDLTTLIFAGKNYEKVCEMCQITLNKSAICFDNGNICLGGVRIGTSGMTSRGCLEGDFETIAEFLVRGAQITLTLQREHGKIQKEFLKGLKTAETLLSSVKGLKQLRPDLQSQDATSECEGETKL